MQLNVVFIKNSDTTANSVKEYSERLKMLYEDPYNDKLTMLPHVAYVELRISESTKEISTTPLTLNDILKPREDDTPVRCVLIEGAPGVGKSRLAWEVCHKWAKNGLDSVKQFELVVLVKLREAQNACNIKDLFPQFDMGDMDNILTAIRNGNGNGLLLVLDGFDELPQNDGPFFKQLIQRLKLQKATIIITSRPSVSAQLVQLCGHRIDRHLEILGFTDEKVEKYVMGVYSDHKRADFLKYINSNPLVKGMMCLPLNAAIIASIFDKRNQFKTMTQLFDGLTRCLIHRRLVKNREFKVDFTISQPLQHMIPPEIAVWFNKLVQMAYDGLIKNEITFNDLDSDFEHLGLMKKTQNSNGWGPTLVFEYLHTTLQEYLAALHIFYSPPDLDVPPSFGKRDVLIRFLAGLCCDNDNVSRKLGTLLQGRDQCSLLLAQCVYECNAIAQKIPVVCKFFNGPIISVCGKMPFDYYLIGHCICHVGGQWSVTVDSKEESARLMDGLRSQQAIRGSILELTLLTGPFEKLKVLTIAGIRCLKLCFVDFIEDDVAILKEQKALQKIDIDISCRNIDLLLHVLFKPSSLKMVHLNGTPSVGSGTDTIADTIQRLLCENRNIEELLINNTIIDPKTLTQVVQSNDTLKELTFCVIENEKLKKSSDASSKHRSLPARAKPSPRSESMLSTLKKAAKKRKIKLHCDTLQAPSHRSHQSVILL